MQTETTPTETTQTEGDIRVRAFDLWDKHGRTHGHADAFWLQAERELRGEATGEPVLLNGFGKSGAGSDCCC